MFGKKWFTVVVLFVVGVPLLFVIFASRHSHNNNTEYYKSYEEAKNNLGYEIEIPEWFISKDNVEYSVFYNQFLTAYNNEFVIKTQLYQGGFVDALGLYDDAETEENYSVVNNKYGIKNLKIRTGYPNYENTVLYNWNTDTVNYGLMVDNIISQNDILEALDISYNELTKVEDYNNKNTVSSNELTYRTYRFNKGHLSLQLPQLCDDVEFEDMGSSVIGFIDGYSAFIIDYKQVSDAIYNDNNTIVLDLGNNVRILMQDYHKLEQDSKTYNILKSLEDNYDIIKNTVVNE